MTWRNVAGAVLIAAAAAAGAAPVDGSEAAEPGAGVLAIVGDTVITAEEYQANLQAGIRQRYFHGQVPADELAALRREVAQSLVDRVLLAEEGRRRGIKPEPGWVDARLDELDARLAADPRWLSIRDGSLREGRRQLDDDSVIRQLRQQVEAVPLPDVAAVREYYRSHPDKFTTPERVRVSIILLKVEPWAPGESWAAAQDEASRLLERLRGGADFADLARLHSADASAERGGDLGYVHRGMFSEETQRVIDELAPGALSAPVRLLQGFAVFRLDERVPPRLNEFALAEERARGLLQRERQEAAWEGMLAGLRSAVSIKINETVLSAGD
ncbi:MAG: peptidylprolyl isomerase [Gammaproteobacteria bacterium]|nr:peptidylprolyl isomerase [Gammaproteobacteria bacterium]